MQIWGGAQALSPQCPFLVPPSINSQHPILPALCFLLPGGLSICSCFPGFGFGTVIWKQFSLTGAPGSWSYGVNTWYNKAECCQGRDRENCPPWELGLSRTSAQPLTPHSVEAVNRPIGLELVRAGPMLGHHWIQPWYK